MADAQMKFYIDVDGFSNASRAVQSLTNFIMENGSLYLRGEYDSTTHALDHMSGVVRMTTQPYNYIDAGGTLSVVGHDVLMQYVTSGIESGVYKDGMPNCITQLVQTSSGGVTIKPYSITDNDGTIEISAISGGFSLSGTITPKIGESTTPNDDPTVLPSGISHTGTSAQMCRTAVAGLNPSGSIRYDVQLRTPTFTVEFDETGNGSFSNPVDLYYKIGICSISGTDSYTNQIVSEVKNGGFIISTLNALYTNYKLGNGEYDIVYDHNYNAAVRKTLLDNDFSGLFNAALFPLTDTSDDLVGFAYMRLCTTNGSNYNGTIINMRGNYWELFRRASSGATPVAVTTDASLPLTDQGLDGSFIVWPES